MNLSSVSLLVIACDSEITNLALGFTKVILVGEGERLRLVTVNEISFSLGSRVFLRGCTS